MSLNSAIGLATSSVLTSQQQMSVVSNNIANATTAGYHRQTTTVGEYNYGVYVSRVQREYDLSLETTMQNAVSDNSYYDTYQQRLSEMESVIGPDGTNYLSNALNTLAAAYQDVATSPEDISSRSSLLSDASTLCSEFNQEYSNLATLRDAICSNDSSGSGYLSIQVDEVNRILTEITNLNTNIHAVEDNDFVGQKALSLRDERDQLMKELSKYASVSFSEDSDTNQYSVSLNLNGSSVTLIDGTQVPQTPPVTMVLSTVEAPAGFFTPQLALSSDPTTPIDLAPETGSLQGLMDSREYICEQMTALYDFATELATQINTIQNGGYDLNGNNNTSPSFVASIFDTVASQPASGSIISVTAAMVGKPRLIAASSAAGQNGDGSNAAAVWNKLNQSGFYNGKSLIDSADTMLSDIALSTSQASSQADSTAVVVKMYEDAVAQRSAVSSDEEMVNMLELQRVYQASAKLLSVLNDMLGTIINMA